MGFVGMDPAGVDQQVSRALRAVESIRSAAEAIGGHLAMAESLDLIDGVDEGCRAVADEISECCDLLRGKASAMVAADAGFAVPAAPGPVYTADGGLMFGSAVGRMLSEFLSDTEGMLLPGPPKNDPGPPGSGDGSGKHGDYRFDAHWVWQLGVLQHWLRWKAIAAGGEALWLDTASRHLDHYLDNTGTDLDVDVDRILRDETVTAEDGDTPLYVKVDNKLSKVSKRALKSGKPVTFTTRWTTYHAKTPNWFYAMGDFKYSVSGVATPHPDGSVTVKYKVHVFDRYNWDPGKKTKFFNGRVVIEDDDPALLHKAGVAQEYINRGTSKVKKKTIRP